MDLSFGGLLDGQLTLSDYYTIFNLSSIIYRVTHTYVSVISSFSILLQTIQPTANFPRLSWPRTAHPSSGSYLADDGWVTGV